MVDWVFLAMLPPVASSVSCCGVWAIKALGWAVRVALWVCADLSVMAGYPDWGTGSVGPCQAEELTDN